MNLLDENVPASQWAFLKRRRIAIRQIGLDIGRKGIKDDEIIRLLHQLDRPTLFTLDRWFHQRRLCHQQYCLVHLSVEEEEAGEFIRALLRHSHFDTAPSDLAELLESPRE